GRAGGGRGAGGGCGGRALPPGCGHAARGARGVAAVGRPVPDARRGRHRRDRPRGAGTSGRGRVIRAIPRWGWALLALAVFVTLAAQAPLLLRRMEAFRVQRVEVLGTRYLAPHDALAASGIADTSSVFDDPAPDRKSTRLNSSHVKNSYAVF